MIIVVNDACLLIDLIDIDLFDEFIQPGFQAHITSAILTEFEGDEYEKPIWESIRQGNLLLYNLTADDQSAIASLMLTHSSRLSEPDCSCLHRTFPIFEIITFTDFSTRWAMSIHSWQISASGS